MFINWTSNIQRYAIYGSANFVLRDIPPPASIKI